MKPIWKLYDVATSNFLSETYDSFDAAHNMSYKLNESVAGASVITVMDMIPEKRFSIYLQARPLVGEPSSWQIYTDADTISEALDKILLSMDQEDELLPYAYKIVHTVSPDLIVLEMQTGEHYPHEKEGEK